MSVQYSVNLEFTIQDKFSKAFDAFNSKLEVIGKNFEEVLEKVNKHLTTVATNASKQIDKATQEAGKSIENTTDKTEKLVGAFDNLLTAKERAMETKPLEQLLIAEKRYDQIMSDIIKKQNALTDISEAYHDIMEDVQTANFHWDEVEQLEKVTKQYIQLRTKEIPLLRLEIEKNGGVEANINKGNVGRLKAFMSLDKQFRRQSEHILGMIGRKEKQYHLETGRSLKRESKDWASLFMFRSNQELQLMRQHADLTLRRLRALKAIGKITDENYEKQKREQELIYKQTEGIERTRDKWDKFKKSTGDAMAGIKSVLNTMGIGKIAEATSLTGLYGMAIMEAAEESEKFHTANFRLVGSIEEIQRSIRDASKETGLLRSELIDSTIALREIGFGAEESLGDLQKVVAGTNRITGAGVEVQAKFARAMSYSTKDTKAATESLYLMQAAARELGLSGKDVDDMLQNATQASYYLGTKGGAYVREYNVALLKAAKAAKDMGVSTKETGDLIKNAYDPDRILLLRGAASSFGLDINKYADDAAGFLKLQSDFAKKFKDDIQGAKTGEELKKALASAQAIMGNIGSNAWDATEALDKMIALEKSMEGKDTSIEKMMQGSEKLAKQNPTEAMAKGLDESSGLTRTLQKLISDFTSTVQQQFGGITETMKDFIKSLGTSDAAIKAALWGSAAVGVASALWNVFAAIKDIGLALIGLKAIFGSFGAGGTAAVGAVSASLAVLAIKAAGVVAIGVMLGGIAWAGYEAAKAWNDAADSIDKTKKAQERAKKGLKEKHAMILDKELPTEVKEINEQLKQLKKHAKEIIPLKEIAPRDRSEIVAKMQDPSKRWEVGGENYWKTYQEQVEKYQDVMRQISILQERRSKIFSEDKGLIEAGKAAAKNLSIGQKQSALNDRLNAQKKELASLEEVVAQKADKPEFFNQEDAAREMEEWKKRITPIQTVQVTTDTGRPAPVQDETIPKEVAVAQAKAVGDIAGLLSGNPDAITKLVNMLHVYLPRIAEGGQKSLNPTANQWT